MQLWTTPVASARGAAAHRAGGRGGRLGRPAGGRFAESVGRSLCLAGACGRGDEAHRSRHRRDQLGDAPRRGDGDRDHLRRPHLQRSRGARHRSRQFGARPSRPRAGAAQAVRALPRAAAGLSCRRQRAVRGDRHSARGRAADVGAASARRAARQPHRLDHGRRQERQRQGAGRGRGQRPQGDRDVGAACRAGDVHPGRRRRAPAMGHRAREEDAPRRRPRSERDRLRRLHQHGLPRPTSRRRAAWCAAASRPSRASR